MKKFTNFNLYLYTDILFGKDTEKETGKMIRKHGGSRVMVVYGGGSVKKSGLFDRVVKAMKDEGLYYVEFGGVKPNPLRSLVDKGIKIARDEKIDFFLGLGGGSAIDTAKDIAIAMANNGEYWKFHKGTVLEKMAPVGTINTIAAAGSETSRSAVLVDDVDGTGHKMGFMWEPARPVFAIMNPELTYTVSPYQTGAGAADILAHTISRYFTKDNLSAWLGDEIAEGLMRTVVKFGPIAVAKPNDYEARAELMISASCSHNDMTGLCKNGPRGGEHPLEHQFSGYYDTAHGAGLAMVMPAWLQYIVDNGTPDMIAKIAQLGVKVFGASPQMDDPKATANDGLERFRAWVHSIGMPLTLEELGVPKAEVPDMVKRTMAANNGKIVGYMDMDEKAVTAIFNSLK